MRHFIINFILIALFGLSACTTSSDQVVVYCTVDQVFSEPILRDFEEETGITVRAVFDTEETKSTGVMNRLIAEKDNPQCDLFWSGDPLRNVVLQSEGITAPYKSEQTDLIPVHFKEKGNHWTGFSARARVLIYNKTLIQADSLPQSILELTHPRYKGRFTIANPLFGTTTFHVAALFSALGNASAEKWMIDLKKNQVLIATSNGDVKKRVMTGEMAFGLTDTDDAFEAKKESSDVDFIFLDQEPGSMGTLIMPNALSMMKDSPNSENGKILMDYLLSRQTEVKLALSCAQMPLIKGTEVPDVVPSLDQIIPTKIEYRKTSEILEQIQPWLKKWVED